MRVLVSAQVHPVHVRAARVALARALERVQAVLAVVSGQAALLQAHPRQVLDPTGPPVVAAVVVLAVVLLVRSAAVAVARSPASRSVRSAQSLNLEKLRHWVA